MRTTAIRKLRFLALGTILLAPVTAAAQQAPQAASYSGGELGLRLGYALPFGESSQGSNLDNGVSAQIPLILDAGYRFNPNMFAGVFLGYGFGQIKDQNNGCNNANANCSASVIRLGLDVLYRFVPEQRFAPFVGVGAGYEWFRLQGATGILGGLSGSSTVSGFEFLNVQAGGDYRLSGNSVIGPFASFSLGRFDNFSTKLTTGGTTTTTSGDINNTAMHEWLLIGVRGAFSL
jgi:outer membrane protein W